jgi:hypothetical protein
MERPAKQQQHKMNALRAESRPEIADARGRLARPVRGRAASPKDWLERAGERELFIRPARRGRSRAAFESEPDAPRASSPWSNYCPCGMSGVGGEQAGSSAAHWAHFAPAHSLTHPVATTSRAGGLGASSIIISSPAMKAAAGLA